MTTATPNPPSFSQMMEDLENMSSDESILKLFRFEHMVDQVEQNETNKEDTIEKKHVGLLINFLHDFKHYDDCRHIMNQQHMNNLK